MAEPGGTVPSRRIMYAATVILAVVTSFFCLSCGNGGKQFGAAVTSRDSMSVMTTYGVSMLISENGVVHYRVSAEEWKVFDRLNPPFHAMEQGVLLHVLDTAMNVESSISADTAYDYYDKKLWELRGNVHAENVKHEKFDTELLFWDDRRGKIYSDSLIRIEQENQIIIGHGFESNSNMTEYTIRKTEGIFPVQDR
ncbi:MAG: LPS export ABC transporter periplasmic protein LptC [Bacteroidaceae bacterium]|nr:LPS export ABC transporter periplasmic protein LptC [Bacteroidaceae bacterium]